VRAGRAEWKDPGRSCTKQRDLVLWPGVAEKEKREPGLALVSENVRPQAVSRGVGRDDE
jgi:hypothetical protein